MTNFSDALATAIRNWRAGQLPEAERLCGQILAADPNAASAWELLGLIYFQSGQPAKAERAFARAIELDPKQASAHYNLGYALRLQGNLPAAIESYHRALELAPNFAEAWSNLGVVLQNVGNTTEAEACYRRALTIRPDLAAAQSSLGSLYQQQNRPTEAEACYRRALDLAPDSLDGLNNLGHLLNAQQNFAEAEIVLRRAVELAPALVAAHNNLGNTLKGLGRFSEAIGCYRRAIELSPGLIDACANLASLLQQQGDLDGAIENYRFAATKPSLGLNAQASRHSTEKIAIPSDEPLAAVVLNNLGSVLKARGEIDEAISCYRRAASLRPNFALEHSNLLYALYFSPSYDAAAILEEHLQFDRQHAAPLAKSIKPHTNRREPNRRLKIGYVSPDFRHHCQSLFTAPILANHDHEQFDIHCYSDVAQPDAMTQRLRGYADAWREITGLSDEQAADLIREDQIDILVDLTMHMAGGRPLLFARKPAPVQLCWLAYPGTTGLSAMDYRLTDPHLDPPGLFDHFYSERSIRLAESFWCYEPLVENVPVGPLPAWKNGFITFGCLNNFCKVNATVLSLWSSVLKAAAQSRFMLLAPTGSCRERTLTFFAENGVVADRILFVDRQPLDDYLRLYQQIDICLDTVPANGHTTTLDALWMGVPVVTLVGHTAIGRGALSQLTNLGLVELAAHTPEDFTCIAADLAADLPRLSQLRSSLRSRMESSPFMDGPRFARNIERAFREMWLAYALTGVRPIE